MSQPLPSEEDTGQLVERSSIRRNVAHMSSSQIATWSLSLLVAIVLPRVLGPEVLGEFQLASSLWAIGAVVVGLGTTLYLQIAIAREQRSGLAMIRPVLMLRTGMFVLVAATLAVYLGVVGGTETFVVVMALIGLSRLLLTWNEVYSTAFVGLERMAATAAVSVGMKLLTVVGVLATLLFGFGVIGVVSVGVISSLVGLIVIVWRFRLTATVPRSDWRGQLVPITKASIPFMMVALANTTYRQIDVIVVSQVAGDRDLGWYGLADVLAGSLLFPATVVIASVLPSMGRLHAENPARLRELVRRTFQLLVLVGVPIGLGTAVVAPSFAPTMFGEDFAGAGDVLVVIGPVLVLTFGTTLLANLALATDKRGFWLVMLFAAAALTIPLDIVLVPWASDRYDNGAIGGALAYVVTETAQFALGLAVVAPYLVTRSMVWRSARVLAAGGAMMLVAWPFRDHFFAIPAIIGAVTFIVAAVVFRVFDDFQRRLIGDVLGRLGLRRRGGGGR